MPDDYAMTLLKGMSEDIELIIDLDEHTGEIVVTSGRSGVSIAYFHPALEKKNLGKSNETRVYLMFSDSDNKTQIGLFVAPGDSTLENVYGEHPFSMKGAYDISDPKFPHNIYDEIRGLLDEQAKACQTSL